jgi:cobalt-zinc-cadmium resistance protein CzcA
MAQPGDDRITNGYRRRCAGDPVPLDHGAIRGGGAGRLGCICCSSGVIGSEFLPHLDEGAIWARGTLAPSTGPTEGTRV